jgi:transcriptional regulator with XRE-family HTH domain
MKLRTYLDKHKLSYAAFGEKIGVSYITVYRYVSGRSLPGKRVMAKIMESTGGSVKPNDFHEQV